MLPRWMTLVGDEVSQVRNQSALKSADAWGSLTGKLDQLLDALRGILKRFDKRAPVRFVVRAEQMGSFGKGLRAALQVPNPVVVQMGKLADDIASATRREGTTHARVADACDEAEIDSVVDLPRLDDLVSHVEDDSSWSGNGSSG